MSQIRKICSMNTIQYAFGFTHFISSPLSAPHSLAGLLVDTKLCVRRYGTVLPEQHRWWKSHVGIWTVAAQHRSTPLLLTCWEKRLFTQKIMASFKKPIRWKFIAEHTVVRKCATNMRKWFTWLVLSLPVFTLEEGGIQHPVVVCRNLPMSSRPHSVRTCINWIRWLAGNHKVTLIGESHLNNP